MKLLLFFLALTTASVVWSNAGVASHNYWAGLYDNTSFVGAPADFLDNDTRHGNPMVIPTDLSVSFVQTPVGARAVTIEKTPNVNSPFFYNFPFATDAVCGTTDCPNAGANAITTSAGSSPFGRAAFLEEGESITFTFNRAGGAFGLSFAIRATDVNAVPVLAFEFGGGIDTATYTPPTVGGALSKLWMEPTTATPHSSTFTTVKITFTGLPVPAGPGIGAWFVFNEIYFGQSGYNCYNKYDQTPNLNTAALSINLTGMPLATSISYDGNTPGAIAPGAQIPNVGDQVVVLCVPPGNPVVSVYDNGYLFQSNVDSTVPIQCGSGHLGSIDARCYLDPRANLTLTLPCLPVLPNTPLSLSLHEVGSTGPFRSNITVSTLKPSFLVLASKTIFAKYDALQLSTAGGSYYSCQKSNAQQSPAVCTVTTPRGPIAKNMEFRIKCNGDALPSIPNKVDVNVTFIYNATYNFEWLLLDVENTDQQLCVPSFGTYKYNAKEFGVNNVTTDDAETSCSTSSLSSRCNTTPLDLVTVVNGPAGCQPTLDCNGLLETEIWAGGNLETGFPLSLSYNGLLFREFSQQPFRPIRQCVLNLNVVEVSATIATLDETVSTVLSANYDCTETEGETPGYCKAYPGNPVNFFEALEVNSGNLKNLDWRIQYTHTSIEGGEIVCSTGILNNSAVCVAQGVQRVCVPALGSAPVTPECGASYLPQRLEIAAQQCPDADACFANNGNASCRPPIEQCISLTVPLDCRTGCAASLTRELCLWDLLALPLDITVDLLAADSNYSAPICTWIEQGMRPGTYEVLATTQRVQLTEGTISINGLVDCSTAAGCTWNDYLSYVDLQAPLAYKGEQVLADVSVSISGTTRTAVPAGKNALLCKPVAVLAAADYTFVYTWAGASRTITNIACTGCPATCTGIPECIVRFFAVDSTTPSQAEYHIVLDAIGQPIAQDDQGRFKSFGNPWSALPVEVCVNGVSVDACSTAYTGAICQPATNQAPIRIYYALAPDADAPYTVSVKLGCDSEEYSLICPTNTDSTGITSCGTECPSPASESTYNKACHFDTTASAMVGPAQSSNCAIGSCNAGWNAVRIFTNNIIDLRKLPNGSSNISSVVPPHGDSNNYRGPAYRDFDGVLTTRINPFDAEICCGTDCSPVPPSDLDCGEEPALSTCANPIVFREVGGYQVVFTGLYHQAPKSYRITIQELFRDETRNQYEEMRPVRIPDACTNEAQNNLEWNHRIKTVRPTVCSVDTPATSECGPSQPGKVCAFLYSDANFIAAWNKGAADNEQGVGQLKFTYSLSFLADLYFGAFFPGQKRDGYRAQVVPWNVDRPHTLLRPNKFAAPADKFYVLKDMWYRTRLNVDQTPVNGPLVQCRSNVPGSDRRHGGWRPSEDYCHVVTLNGTPPRVIPFQAIAAKK